VLYDPIVTGHELAPASIAATAVLKKELRGLLFRQDGARFVVPGRTCHRAPFRQLGDRESDLGLVSASSTDMPLRMRRDIADDPIPIRLAHSSSVMVSPFRDK
jgi:hypothetical protein